MQWGEKMKIVVARFETYPIDTPRGYVVGFTVILGNKRTFYRDVIIPFNETEQRTDEEIVQEAYSLLKENIQQEVDRLTSLSPIVGTTLILPVEEEEPAENGGV